MIICLCKNDLDNLVQIQSKLVTAKSSEWWELVNAIQKPKRLWLG